jgi:hypothetical protein
MKKLVLLLSLLTASGGPIFAQQYSIAWFKVAGGGGTSSNAQYIVNGTIGQPDASVAMTGGSYSVTGGFWSLYAVQTPGAPLLTIRLTGANSATVSWPSVSTGFVLQQNASLTTTNWSDFAGTTNDDGVTKSVNIPSTAGNLFFRLKQ